MPGGYGYRHVSFAATDAGDGFLRLRTSEGSRAAPLAG
jgi:hypothetical protein